MYQKPQQNKVYTVTLLNKEIRFLLEKNFASLTLSGEISNFVAPSSGHWYFSLKDDTAQIRAAMWRGNNRTATFKPKNGDQVLVRARVSLYEPRGDYQLIVEHIEPAGVGLLKQEFEALKMKLASEGLFSSQYKKPLPHDVRKLGVITSATGAAVKDIIEVLKQRAPHIEVIIYPAQVQGDNAAEQLIAQIAQANQRNEVDVLIIGRGGGSLEDLWCFNHEVLARAIFDSALPIVSAVGHEIDTTICDYVADLRAATPSQAAELVSPDSQHIENQIKQIKHRLCQATNTYLTHQQHSLSGLEQKLALYHPNNQLQQQGQFRDELEMRLKSSLNALLNQKLNQHHQIKLKLAQHSAQSQVSDARHLVEQLKSRLCNAQQQQLEQAKKQLAIQCATLDATSPLAVLGRGYSVTSSKGKVLSSVSSVNEGHALVTKLSDGEVFSTVEKVKPNE